LKAGIYFKAGKKMLKKGQWSRNKRHASASGICFEPLEPRLLLSGSWAAGIDSPARACLSDTQSDFAQQTVAIHESAGNSVADRQLEGQNPAGAGAVVDILAQLPKLDEFDFGTVESIRDNPSPPDEKALSATDSRTTIPDDSASNGSNPLLQQESVVLAERRELVFVDSVISDYQQLVEDLIASCSDCRAIEVVALDAGRDGIEQVSGALEGRSGLAAVHFITHGSDGQINLGNTGLNSATLEQNRAMVSRWGDALNETGDILFYGCNIAADSAGQSLLNNIAELTGADVAASDDITGNAISGGNWVLEYTRGAVETGLAFTTTDQQGWIGVLGQINVTTTNDTLDGDANTTSLAALTLNPGADGKVSLREAIIAANNTVGADTVSLAAGTYALSRAGTNENAANTGDLDITDSLTISGAGANATYVDGGAWDRVFEVHNGSIVSIQGVTIRNGAAPNYGGGLYISDAGAQVNLNAVVVTGNSAVSGSGIYNVRSSLTAIDTAIEANTAVDWGGGIYNERGTVSLDRVTIAGNSAGKDGGGLYSFGSGALLTLTNVTASGNTALGVGGGLYTNQDVTATNVTLAFNSAGGGAGGIYQQSPGTVSLKNSILANNTGGNSNGALISLGNNLDSQNTAGLSGPGDQIMTDPLLGALGYNGGQTKTHALLAGSPAINAGTNLGAPAVDGRGFQRSDGRTDTGAFEVGAGLIEKVYWADQTNNKIQRANLDGSNVEDVLTSADGVNSPTGVLVDAENGKIYWSEFLTGKIRRANLDGTNIENLYSGLSSPAGMALDTANSKLYWTENPLFLGTNRIRCAEMNGGGAIQDLVTTGTNDPVDMALDLKAGKIYWTDGNNGEIRRANLDGTNAVVFLSGLTKPQGLELDLNARMMYWASDGTITNKIQRANMDGPIVVQDLVTTGLDSPIGIELDLATGKIYWSDWGTRKIQTANLDGSNVQNLVSSGLSLPIGIALGPGGNDAPVGVPVITGTVAEDQTLTANTGGISDADGLGAFSYQWLRNGSAISGATASTYTLGDADVGTQISVQVSYTDGQGTAETLTSAQTAAVANVNDAPVISSDGGGATASINVAENTTAVTTVVATDAEGAMPAFSISGGADAAHFTIGASTGVLRFVAAPNFEAPADVGVDNVYDVIVHVDDAEGGSDTQALAVTVTDVIGAPGAATGMLWFTTATGQTPAAGGTTWSAGQVLQYGNFGDRFDINGGTTTGTVDVLAGFNAPVPVRGMHYVQTSITIGTTGTQFTLNPGDLLLVLDPGVGTVALNGGDGNPANDFSADRKDIVVFRPTVAGNYASGEYFMLLDDGVKNGGATYNVHALALVETATTVGGVVLPAGTFVVAHSSPSLHYNVYTFTASGTGAAAATQTSDTALLLSGSAISTSTSQIQGLHLLSGPTAFNDSVLPAGTLMVAVNGSNADYAGVSQDRFDIIVLNITRTALNGGTLATGQMLFDGSELGLTASSVNLSGFTVVTGAVTNSAPVVAVPIADQSATQDLAFTYTVPAGAFSDSDAGDTLTYSASLTGGGGLPGWLSFNPGTRQFSGTPLNADVGAISLRVTATDTGGAQATSDFTLTVANVNDAPVANNDSATTDEDTPITVNVVGNDTDVDGDSLVVSSVTQSTNGTVTFAGGSVTYTPNANFNGSDSFTYTVSDGNGGTATATVSVTVTLVNDAPLANNDSTNTNEDAPVTVSLVANDIDVENDTLTVSAVTQGANGSVTFAGGSVTYTPNGNFNGSDSFTYTVSDGNGGTAIATVNLTVTPVNDAPLATDDITSTNEDTPITVNVVANDTDVENDTLTVSAVTQGANGKVTFAAGLVTYTPNANFNGSDSYTYTVSDGNGGSATATVNVTVNPVNDAPVANNDSATTNEDTPVTVNVVANDSDVEGDSLTVSGVTQGTNGTVSFAGGSVTYTPNANFNVSDSFTYTVSDGNGGTDTSTVNVTVNPVNDAPIANDDSTITNEDNPVTVNVVGNDTDVEGNSLTVSAVTQGTNGTVSFAGGSVTYTPNGNFNGSDSFTYTVSEGNGGTSIATVNVAVNPVNDAPTGAVTITGTPTEDQMLTADASGISDADRLGAFSYQWLRNGTEIAGAANSNYTLGDADVGTVITVVVRYTDGQGTHESVTSAGVGPIGNVNEAPVANADSYTSAENTPLTATLGVDDLLKNDSDIDGDLLAVNPTPVRDASHGTLVLNADGTFIYAPNANFTGVDSFTYEVSDGKGGTAQATVTISVSAANPAPTGGDSIEPKTDVAQPPTASPDTSLPSLPAHTDAAPNESDKVSEQAEVPEKGVLQENVLNQSNPVSSLDSIKKNAVSGSSIRAAFRSFLQAVSRDSIPADAVTVSINLNDVKESLSTREPARDKPATAVQKQNLRAEQAYKVMLVRAYEYLRNSLDAVKEEMASDHQLSKVYLGSAIVSSVGLSVGYVVWLLRGGMLLGSLLSSLPAWQILDPLPILARKKDGEHSDDPESLESILKQKQRKPNPKEKPADASSDAEVKKR
jgi:hypothetical protein